MAKSKTPKVLEDLASEIDEGFIEDTFEVGKHFYTMRLLTDGETNWKNRFIDAMSSALSMLSQRKAPTLAIAIRKIDHVSVEEIFKPEKPADDAEESDKKAYDEWNKLSKVERQFRIAESLFNYLSERPAEFTTALYNKYSELEKRREEVIKNLKN